MNHQDNPAWVKPSIWLLTLLVLILPLLAWGNKLSWDFSNLSAYTLFPLFGLLAFSIMWAHFAVGFLKRLWPKSADYKTYYRTTGNMVLVLILMHPILLYSQLVENKLNAFDYVGPEKTVFIWFAYLAITTFLFYEVVDHLREVKLVKSMWPIIKGVNIAAFVLIYWHGLMLGQHLQSGWLRSVWIVYGITGLFFIAYGYWHDFTNNQQEPS